MLKLNTCILQQYFIRVCKRIIEAICSFSRSSSSLRENGLYPNIHWLNNYASRRSCTCVRVDESICPYLYKHRTQLQGVGKYHCWAISVWNNILVVFFFGPTKWLTILPSLPCLVPAPIQIKFLMEVQHIRNENKDSTEVSTVP
jgi:hypothetical protein